MADSPLEPATPPTGRIRTLLLLAAGLQLLVLLGLGGKRFMMLRRGQTVLVQVQPVDPRDMFRGDYVTLSYDFSRPGGVVGLAGPYARESQGRTVYAWLVPEGDGRHWRAEQVSTQTPPPGRKYLRGTIGHRGQPEFGIESFYVQEGKGIQYEHAVRQRQLSAEVAVAPNGQATLRSLKIGP